MPVKPLPSNPDLDHLKYQAKDLLKDHAARNSSLAQRLREFHPRFANSTDAEIFDASLQLSDAQLTIARESGFSSWARLKRHIEKPTLSDNLALPHHARIHDLTFRSAVELLDAGSVDALRQLLSSHPNLSRHRVVFEGGNYFRNPSLLEFIAENPIRRGTLPQNIVQVANVILDAGVEQSALDETLMLVATGSVPRQCRVQIPLINILCDHGANPATSTEPAALHAEFDSLNALISRGARITFPIAAALGNLEDFRRLFPLANIRDRHLALALASQFGHVEIVRLLLDAGEDPNRFNPVGGHSHATPLHQAALAGHFELVRLFVERGSRLDIKDIHWHATPAGWAQHAGHTEIDTYLRAQESTKK
jgi:hypothetical protein